MLPRKWQDLASSWGISIVRLHMFLPTPAGLRAPDHYSAAAWPLVCEQQRLPRWVFRRSIAWLSDSLSTLRRAGYPNHHARLASGRWSGATGRAFHPQDSNERFRICFLHLFLLSQASCRNHIHLGQLPLTAPFNRCHHIDGAVRLLSGSGLTGSNGMIPFRRRAQRGGLQSSQALQAVLHWWTFPECRLYWPEPASVRHTNGT